MKEKEAKNKIDKNEKSQIENTLFSKTNRILNIIPVIPLEKTKNKYPLIKIHEIDYKKKYHFILKEIENKKIELIKERMIGIELKKELNKFLPNENRFDNLYNENIIIINENKKLSKDIESFDETNKKQNQLINSLRKKYNKIKKISKKKKEN